MIGRNWTVETTKISFTYYYAKIVLSKKVIRQRDSGMFKFLYRECNY